MKKQFSQDKALFYSFPAHYFFLGVALLIAPLACQSRPLAPPAPQASQPQPPSPTPQDDQSPHAVRLVNLTQAPKLGEILQQIHLRYDPNMSPEERDQDFLEKIDRTRQLTGIRRLKEMRDRSLCLINNNGGEISWEFLRRLKWSDGTPVGVTLTAPVWVPARAKPVITYAAFAKKWEEVALTKPRASGNVYFAGELNDINHKDGYRAAGIKFEANSLHAPFAALLLEYIFREGWYEPGKRIPLLVIRCGEDTYAASANSGPVTAEALSFCDKEGDNLEATKVRGSYPSLAEIHHGRHAPSSNHRLGCAFDLNDFNFKNLVDGIPNPISYSRRQSNRDAMHRLDARNLPAWVYRAAKQIGYRIPQEWIHVGCSTDWPHFDCGNK
jgi:hypothetical protein